MHNFQEVSYTKILDRIYLTDEKKKQYISNLRRLGNSDERIAELLDLDTDNLPTNIFD